MSVSSRSKYAWTMPSDTYWKLMCPRSSSSIWNLSWASNKRSYCIAFLRQHWREGSLSPVALLHWLITSGSAAKIWFSLKFITCSVSADLNQDMAMYNKSGTNSLDECTTTAGSVRPCDLWHVMALARMTGNWQTLPILDPGFPLNGHSPNVFKINLMFIPFFDPSENPHASIPQIVRLVPN